MSGSTGLMPGLVVASFGRHVLVEDAAGREVICHPRGKKNQAVVGDQVLWQVTGDEGSIERVQERRNLFYRQDEIRTKSFAANLDQVLILLAAEPEFSESQLARALIAAEAEHIDVVIALNKRDLTELHARAWQRLRAYVEMGYRCLPLSLKADADLALLREQLEGKVTLVLGPSGAGKSTLINRLVPGAQVLTGEISTALNSGKHTTTSTRWYWMDPGKKSALLDSPGFQEFGLHHVEAAQLASLMPDLKAHLGSCRFYNCSHIHEPGCGVTAAVNGLAGGAGSDDTKRQGIHPNRYKIYSTLYEELSQSKY